MCWYFCELSSVLQISTLAEKESEQKTHRRDGDSGEMLSVLLCRETYKQVYDKIETVAFCTRFHPGSSSWPRTPASIPPQPRTVREPPPSFGTFLYYFAACALASASGGLSSPATPPQVMPGSVLSFLHLDNYILRPFQHLVHAKSIPPVRNFAS